MLKKILLFLILIATIFSVLTTLKIAKNPYISSNKTIQKVENNEQLGKLVIEKINLNQPLFKINSKKNNVEENITILKESTLPENENSIVFIAAHSGTGDIAYFEELDQLIKNDEINLTINKKTYHYIVKDIWEEKKNGYINVNKEKENQLILTTCSPTKRDYQLIVNCIEKE